MKNLLISMANVLFPDEADDNKIMVNDIFLKEGKFKIKGNSYNPADFTHVSSLSNLFLTLKLSEELKTDKQNSFGFKSNPEETKQKYNHIFRKREETKTDYKHEFNFEIDTN